jgi:hypothetical protein
MVISPRATETEAELSSTIADAEATEWMEKF